MTEASFVRIQLVTQLSQCISLPDQIAQSQHELITLIIKLALKPVLSGLIINKLAVAVECQPPYSDNNPGYNAQRSEYTEPSPIRFSGKAS